VAISAHVNAGCFQILGVTPAPTTNAVGDNVGTYSCDSNGTCTLIDSSFDASAPYTPIAPDEEEINVAPENPNSTAPSTTANKSGVATTDICFGGGGIGGGGGGGGSSLPTLPRVISTARREARYTSVRPFWNPAGGGNGGAPNGGSRAMRDIPNQSTKACSDPKSERAAAALASLGLGGGIARFAVVRTTDGKNETWGRDSLNVPFSLVSSDCPNPNN
jgi:hypothetical protein